MFGESSEVNRVFSATSFRWEQNNRQRPCRHFLGEYPLNTCKMWRPFLELTKICSGRSDHHKTQKTRTQGGSYRSRQKRHVYHLTAKLEEERKLRYKYSTRENGSFDVVRPLRFVYCTVVARHINNSQQCRRDEDILQRLTSQFHFSLRGVV